MQTCIDSTTTPKTCTKCGSSYPRTREYFRVDKRATDGLKSECKICARGCDSTYRKTNPEKRYEDHKRWQEENPDKALAYVENWREANPQKQQAHQAVAIAVKTGRLAQLSTLKCIQCGLKAEEYHHFSYEPEHQLDVIPLCKKCHRRLHSVSEMGAQS